MGPDHVPPHVGLPGSDHVAELVSKGGTPTPFAEGVVIVGFFEGGEVLVVF